MIESPVLIHGESGSGKELVARTSHAISSRRDKPFIKVNCAALNENAMIEAISKMQITFKDKRHTLINTIRCEIPPTRWRKRLCWAFSAP